jgi:predicted nucleic acid-binding protein
MTSAGLLLDTSAAVPLLLETHPAHSVVKAATRRQSLGLTAHSCAETYSVLTRLPGDARLTARDAADLIDRRFVEVVSLSGDSAATFHRRLAELAIQGGAVYDGLVGLAAASTRPLLSRDQRARPTYAALGVHVIRC